MKTHLIVTIDTEEDGLWTNTYRRAGNTVRNIRGVESFQHICDRFDVRPTYLVDAPVAQDDEATRFLSRIQASGRAEIGAHIHPWCNPPFEEECTPRNSYLCNLPPALQQRKIEWLTETISLRFGRRPTSFRAGRYGLDGVGASILERQGYLADSSVIPFHDYSADGGPDFSNFPHDPFPLDSAEFGSPSRQSPLLEVPVTVGFNRRDFRVAHRIRNMALRRPWRQLRAVGVMDRLGLLQRLKFSPETCRLAQLKRLFDVRAAQGAPCLVLMFHSSSLVAGGSPYVPDDQSLQSFLSCFVRLFEYVVITNDSPTATLSEFASKFTQCRMAA